MLKFKGLRKRQLALACPYQYITHSTPLNSSFRWLRSCCSYRNVNLEVLCCRHSVLLCIVTSAKEVWPSSFMSYVYFACSASWYRKQLTFAFILSLMMKLKQARQSPTFIALHAATTCSLMLSGGPTNGWRSLTRNTWWKFLLIIRRRASNSWATQHRHQLTLQDQGYRASGSCGVPVYVPAFTGTHCTYPRSDGQAELTWVAGYILRWFTHLQTVISPSTNQARRRLTNCYQLVSYITWRNYNCYYVKKIKGATPHIGHRQGAHLPDTGHSHSSRTTKSMTHGQRNARPTVTFPAAEDQHSLAGTNLYWLVTEVRAWNNLPRVVTCQRSSRESHSWLFHHIPMPNHWETTTYYYYLQLTITTITWTSKWFLPARPSVCPALAPNLTTIEHRKKTKVVQKFPYYGAPTMALIASRQTSAGSLFYNVSQNSKCQ